MFIFWFVCSIWNPQQPSNPYWSLKKMWLYYCTLYIRKNLKLCARALFSISLRLRLIWCRLYHAASFSYYCRYVTFSRVLVTSTGHVRHVTTVDWWHCGLPWNLLLFIASVMYLTNVTRRACWLFCIEITRIQHFPYNISLGRLTMCIGQP